MKHIASSAEKVASAARRRRTYGHILVSWEGSQRLLVGQCGLRASSSSTSRCRSIAAASCAGTESPCMNTLPPPSTKMLVYLPRASG